MATTTGRTHCITCGKEKATFKCGGCLQEFCFKHLGDHKQELSKQLDEVEINRDLFRQTLTEQTTDPQKHALIQEINKWERESINIIRQRAEESRQLVLKNTTEYIRDLETKLNKLTDQLRESREENDFFETDLHRWNDELTLLAEELAKPANIKLQQDITPLITNISVNITSASLYRLRIGTNVKWVQNGITVAGGNGKGNESNQLSTPWGLFVNDDQTFYVADYANNRIVEWKRDTTGGRVVAGGRGLGNQTNQFNGPTDVLIDQKHDCLIIADRGNKRIVQWPRQNGTSGQTIISNVDCWGLAMGNDGCLYVADYDKSEVRRWQVGETSGTIVAGGNGKGDRLNQLNGRLHIFIDEELSVYVSDENNHRVMKWLRGAKEGTVVAGGQGQGNSLTQLSYPQGVVVDKLGTVYVADSGNNRIICWPKETRQGSVAVGGNGKGEQANQVSRPLGLKFDRYSNLYVVDNENHRVQQFNIDLS